jgi:hypothetical protein
VSDDADDVLAEIIESAKAFTGAKTVTPQTRLYADLGMDGDDADEFLMAFETEYGVDMTPMVWQRFFSDEPTMTDMLTPAIVLASSVLSPSFAVRWQAARLAEREVTIAHLANVAHSKLWRDPSETSARQHKSSGLSLIFSSIALLIMALFIVLGVIVIYAFLAGEMGERRVLALVGLAAMSIVLPVHLAHASWRQIRAKLASAGDS